MKNIKLNNIKIGESLESCILNSDNNNNIHIGISSNALVIINKFPVTSKLDYKHLLEGDDKEMLVLEGSSECITHFIHKCFDIRDSNTSVEFTFDNYNRKLMFQ